MTTSTSSPPLRLRVVQDGPEAATTVLKRTSLGDLEVDPAVAARSAAVFDTPELRDLLSSVGLAPASADEALSPELFVERVVRLVRSAGDRALRLIAERLDGALPADLETGPAEIAVAYQQVDEQLVADLRLAADRIRRFHEHQRRPTWLDVDEGLGQIIRPLERVGIYAPLSTAAYPSSVLMAAVPARVAGVDEVVLSMPPRPDGRHRPEMIVAADIAGVDRLFKIGGAQAIAALAYGTESVPKVDKILGPGNIFVVLAKKHVFGDVDIDQLPGPTETLVVADDTAPADEVAADLLAQAEHDLLASAILITSSERLAAAVPPRWRSSSASWSAPRSPASRSNGGAASSSSPVWSVPWCWLTSTPRSTSVCLLPMPGPICRRSRMPVASSWGVTRRKPPETTWPAPRTSCPRALPRVSHRRYPWTTSARSRA